MLDLCTFLSWSGFTGESSIMVRGLFILAEKNCVNNVVVFFKHTTSLKKVLFDGLESCGFLVDYCDVLISSLISHSDGTHSLQSIIGEQGGYIFSKTIPLIIWPKDITKHVWTISRSFHFIIYLFLFQWVMVSPTRLSHCLCVLGVCWWIPEGNVFKEWWIITVACVNVF